ncbi:MAG: molybdate ABC transporter substrate-binding protein [Crocinitomicaceae bacterium]|nr:molybdate ABC transporter substrate-binding protein [Crocinitomicaceae bacterium]
MPRFILTFTLLVVLSAGGCSPSNEQDKLTVVVAASAQFAFRDIAEEFSKNNNVAVDIITGSSGKLTTQILYGAPYDILVSANMHYVEVLENSEKTHGEPFVYGCGVPIVWTMNAEFDLDSIASYFCLPDVERIAIADPKNAPYGEVAVKYLKSLGIYEKVKGKLVFGESISQVNEYVLNKTVDVGITAKSIVASPKLKGKGFYRELGEDFYIDQGMALINTKTTHDLKTKFKAFVQSEEGVNILESYGYKLSK